MNVLTSPVIQERTEDIITQRRKAEALEREGRQQEARKMYGAKCTCCGRTAESLERGPHAIDLGLRVSAVFQVYDWDHNTTNQRCMLAQASSLRHLQNLGWPRVLPRRYWFGPVEVPERAIICILCEDCRSILRRKASPQAQAIWRTFQDALNELVEQEKQARAS